MIRTALLLAAALTTARSITGRAEELILGAEVGKTEFFEDEPIYLLVRLQNRGTDTAWTYFFRWFSPALTLSVSQGHMEPVEVSKGILDYRVPASWRGEPVPPGASFVKTIVLQDIMGDEQDISTHLFAHHLAIDDYELHVAFAAHSELPGTTPLTVKAAPVRFRVRARSSAEETEVRELEGMRRMGWDATSVAGYPHAVGYQASLIHMVERRLREEPDDPFLPFLLYNGLSVIGKVLEDQIVAGKVAWFDPDTSGNVGRLRLAVIERQRLSVAGAHLVQGLGARHPEQLAVLAASLGSTPGGEMARYQVERAHRVHQIKTPLPR